MTASEFKAWLKGYAEAIGDTPTSDQWKRVLEEAQKIAAPIPYQQRSGAAVGGLGGGMAYLGQAQNPGVY